MIRNKVAHCYDKANNADKVYMCCIRTVTTNEFLVLAKWGRRHAKMNVQVKGTYTTVEEAEKEQKKYFSNKLINGYRSIDDPSYLDFMQKQGMTPLTLTSGELQAYVEGTSIPIPAKEPEDKVGDTSQVEDEQPDFGPVDKSEDDVMVCVDNSGIEVDFDVGIEYVVEKHKDPHMIYAYNKMGKKLEYFRNRFVRQKISVGNSPAVIKNLSEYEGYNVSVLKMRTYDHLEKNGYTHYQTLLTSKNEMYQIYTGAKNDIY